MEEKMNLQSSKTIEGMMQHGIQKPVKGQARSPKALVMRKGSSFGHLLTEVKKNVSFHSFK
jgi:hypothetical protein